MTRSKKSSIGRTAYRELGIFALLMTALTAFLLTQDGLWEKLGFLFFGALITFLSVFVIDDTKRAIQATDLARALYEELANRVARCLFDFERPWEKWIDGPVEIDVLRLRKFMPAPPVIYPATASQIALLGNGAPQAIINFYARLAAYQKDMEDVADHCKRLNIAVPPKLVAMIAGRLERTLSPGLEALKKLSKMVEGDEKIEAAAIRELDRLFQHERANQTLRQRIEHYLTE